MDIAQSFIQPFVVFEEWRPAVGYSTYECSSLGNVRNKITLQLCTKKPARGGYKVVSLYRADRQKIGLVRVAAIIARTFLGPTPPGMQIDHINGDNTDDRASNLQFLTQSANIQKSFDSDPLRRWRGYKARRYSIEFHDEVRRLSALGHSQVAIGKHLGCNNSTCSKILAGKMKPRNSEPTGQVFSGEPAPSLSPTRGSISDTRRQRWQKILELLAANPQMSVLALSRACDISYRVMTDDIRKLVARGALERTSNPGMPNTWRVLRTTI